MILIDAATGKREGRADTPQALSPETPRCAFCGRGSSDCARLFAGKTDDAMICDRCVRLGAAMIVSAKATP